MSWTFSQHCSYPALWAPPGGFMLLLCFLSPPLSLSVAPARRHPHLVQFQRPVQRRRLDHLPQRGVGQAGCGWALQPPLLRSAGPPAVLQLTPPPPSLSLSSRHRALTPPPRLPHGTEQTPVDISAPRSSYWTFTLPMIWPVLLHTTTLLPPHTPDATGGVWTSSGGKRLKSLSLALWSWLCGSHCVLAPTVISGCGEEVLWSLDPCVSVAQCI